MKGWMRKGLALGALGVVLGAAPVSQAAAADIVFGLLDDMSMVAAETGQDALHAIQIAVEEANNAGGIKGHKIRLVVYDGKQDPQLSSTLATRFAEEDKGLVLIGGNPAVPTAAVIRTANELKVPYFSLSAATDSFTNPSTEYHFRFGPANSQDAVAVSDFIAERGFKRVAIINNSLPYGLDGGGAVERTLKARGLQVVARETYDTNATDLSPQVLRIRAARPEVVVIWPYPADGGRVLRTLAQYKVDAFRVVARIALYETMRKTAGESGDGALVTNTVDTDRPEVQAFFKTFGARWGEKPPTMYIAMAYDAARVAIQVAGQPEVLAAWDKGDVAGARAAFKNAVEKIGSFKGLQGKASASYHFGPMQHQGPPNKDWFVWMGLKDTKLVKPDLSIVKPKR
jgi:ABC-type branched-subunit amino acid transport system substrate-binding protein